MQNQNKKVLISTIPKVVINPATVLGLIRRSTFYRLADYFQYFKTIFTISFSCLALVAASP